MSVITIALSGFGVLFLLGFLATWVDNRVAERKLQTGSSNEVQHKLRNHERRIWDLGCELECEVRNWKKDIKELRAEVRELQKAVSDLKAKLDHRKKGVVATHTYDGRKLTQGEIDALVKGPIAAVSGQVAEAIARVDPANITREAA